jgi:hypothetical protein
MDLAALAANLSLDDMPFVRAIGDIFGKTDADLRRDVASLKRTCTEEVRPISPQFRCERPFANLLPYTS